MLMSICSIDNEFDVWHLWVDNIAKSVTNFKVSFFLELFIPNYFSIIYADISW